MKKSMRVFLGLSLRISQNLKF